MCLSTLVGAARHLPLAQPPPRRPITSKYQTGVTGLVSIDIFTTIPGCFRSESEALLYVACGEPVFVSVLPSVWVLFYEAPHPHMLGARQARVASVGGRVLVLNCFGDGAAFSTMPSNAAMDSSWRRITAVDWKPQACSLYIIRSLHGAGAWRQEQRDFCLPRAPTGRASRPEMSRRRKPRPAIH